MHKLKPSETAPIRAALGQILLHDEQARFGHRLHVVLLVGLGFSCYEVAGWFGEHPRTIERWVTAYEAGGLAALCHHQHAGRPSLLSPPELSRLAGELHAPPATLGYPQPHWSGKLLVRHLKRCYGRDIGVRQGQRLLRELASSVRPVEPLDSWRRQEPRGH